MTPKESERDKYRDRKKEWGYLIGADDVCRGGSTPQRLG